ncbi:MAG: FAD-binding protein, partial [Halobacteria archaeon]|nr:FAD-binding protein [Halobacteria archaeon]
RSVVCSPDEIHKPETENEIVELVEKARNEGREIRVAGAGHSFTRVVETNDILVSLENFTGIEDIDKNARTATVRAGTPLGELNPALYSKGLAMENLGDIVDAIAETTDGIREVAAATDDQAETSINRASQERSARGRTGRGSFKFWLLRLRESDL